MKTRLVIPMFLAFLAAAGPNAATEPKQPLRRSESFLGIHFDLDAGPDDRQMGARTMPETVHTIVNQSKQHQTKGE